MSHMFVLRLEVFFSLVAGLGAIFLIFLLRQVIKSQGLSRRHDWMPFYIAFIFLAVGSFSHILLSHEVFDSQYLGEGGAALALFFGTVVGKVFLVIVLGIGVYYLVPSFSRLLKIEEKLKSLCYIYEGFGQHQDDRLKEKEKELEEALKDSKRSSEERRALISSIEREFKNPIYAVAGLSEILLDTDLDENQYTCVEAMQSSVKSLKCKIDSLVNLERISQPQHSLDKESVSLRGLLKKLELDFRGDDFKSVNLKFEVGDAVPHLVRTDSRSLLKMLTSLLENAFLHGKQNGKISVLISLDRINSNEALICFQIKDNRGHLSHDELNRVLGIFSDMDNYSHTKDLIKNNEDVKLTLVKNIAQSMNGWCGVKNDDGENVSFWFRLPLEILSDDEGEGGGGSHEKPNREETVLRYGKKQDAFEGENEVKDFSQMSVLIVDDQPINLLVARRHLEKIGVQKDRIDEAKDGRQAVEKIKSCDYDLVLMDCQMPVMDGFMATKLIRESERTKGRRSTPIIALTANVMSGVKEECLSVGMNDYMSKPSSAQTFKTMIEKWAQGDGSTVSA